MSRKLTRLVVLVLLLTSSVSAYGYCQFECRYEIDDVYCGLGLSMTDCDTTGSCGWVCWGGGCFVYCDERCVGNQCYQV